MVKNNAKCISHGIYAMMQAGISQNKIADKLAVHRSTIWRELQRNTGLRGYRPKQASTKNLTTSAGFAQGGQDDRQYDKVS